MLEIKNRNWGWGVVLMFCDGGRSHCFSTSPLHLDHPPKAQSKHMQASAVTVFSVQLMRLKIILNNTFYFRWLFTRQEIFSYSHHYYLYLLGKSFAVACATANVSSFLPKAVSSVFCLLVSMGRLPYTWDMCI